jgi:hypothetical protein
VETGKVLGCCVGLIKTDGVETTIGSFVSTEVALAGEFSSTDFDPLIFGTSCREKNNNAEITTKMKTATKRA